MAILYKNGFLNLRTNDSKDRYFKSVGSGQCPYDYGSLGRGGKCPSCGARFEYRVRDIGRTG